jgi:hypothetical protein
MLLFTALPAGAQTKVVSSTSSYLDDHESARSDKFTGGRIEKAALQPGEPDIEITVNVPAFRLTLWQNGKEVKTYPIGVGQKDFPIAIGERQATEVIWNPAWIPPDSDWVHERSGVRPGEIIKASDPRNPLGKLKIPLGGGYLIHQAKGVGDLGGLVSHGCVRMLQSDLYDLAEKIVAARSSPVTKKQIERAKRGSRQLMAKLDEPLIVDINYDTEVVEGGVLYLYPDVYERGTATVERLREELKENEVDTSTLSDRTLARMLGRVGRRAAYVVSVESIAAGRALTDGRARPLSGRAVESKAPTRKRVASL